MRLQSISLATALPALLLLIPTTRAEGILSAREDLPGCAVRSALSPRMLLAF